MKTTISHWCDEICRIVDEYGVKDLQNVLPLITDSLFELHIPVFVCITKNVKVTSFDESNLGWVEPQDTDESCQFT